MSRVEDSRINLKAPKEWRLLDWERPLLVIDSKDSLGAALTRLPETGATANRIVQLESPGGDTLSIGIASPLDGQNPALTQPLACVNFTNASLDPPYLSVVGDATLNYENGGGVVFQFDGSWTEIPRRNCVPVDVMVRIAQHFYSTGGLPDWITWEEM